MQDSNKNKLFNKNFFLLWQGQLVSKLGSQVFFVAMVLWIKDVTQSASLLGLLGFVSGIPLVIFSVIGGAYADRHSRKKIIVYSDLVSGIIVMFLGFVLLYFPDSGTPVLVTLFIVTILSGVVESFFSPAISAAIPDIVPKENLSSGNAWIQGARQFTTIVGWAVGGTLYVLLGAPLLVFINAVTFLFSAFSELFIQIPQVIPEKTKIWKEKYRQFKIDTIEGFKYIWKRAGLRNLVLASVFMNFFAAPIFLLLPFYVSNNLKLANDWFGYLVAISSFGAVIGYILAGALKLNKNNRALLILLFMLAGGITNILMGLFPYLYPAIIIFFVSGFLGGYVQVQIFTILQLTTEAGIRGRIFGFLGTISAALAPIGMGIAGVLADLTNKSIPLIYIGCGVSITVLVLLIIPNKAVRNLLAFEESNIKDGDHTESSESENKDDKNEVSDIPLNLTAMQTIEKKIKEQQNK